MIKIGSGGGASNNSRDARAPPIAQHSTHPSTRLILSTCLLTQHSSSPHSSPLARTPSPATSSALRKCPSLPPPYRSFHRRYSSPVTILAIRPASTRTTTSAAVLLSSPSPHHCRRSYPPPPQSPLTWSPLPPWMSPPAIAGAADKHRCRHANRGGPTNHHKAYLLPLPRSLPQPPNPPPPRTFTTTDEDTRRCRRRRYRH